MEIGSTVKITNGGEGKRLGVVIDRLEKDRDMFVVELNKGFYPEGDDDLYVRVIVAYEGNLKVVSAP